MVCVLNADEVLHARASSQNSFLLWIDVCTLWAVTLQHVLSVRFYAPNTHQIALTRSDMHFDNNTRKEQYNPNLFVSVERPFALLPVQTCLEVIQMFHLIRASARKVFRVFGCNCVHDFPATMCHIHSGHLKTWRNDFSCEFVAPKSLQISSDVRRVLRF